MKTELYGRAVHIGAGDGLESYVPEWESLLPCDREPDFNVTILKGGEPDWEEREFMKGAFRIRHSTGRIELGVVKASPPVTSLLLSYLLRRRLVLDDRGELVFHSGGVSAASGAVLLTGPPGAGKTTVTRHLEAAGFPVLGEDSVAVTFEGAAKPLPTMTFHPARFGPPAPVSALYALSFRQGTELSAEPLPPGQAVQEVSRSLFNLKAVGQKGFRAFVQLCTTVPVTGLTFSEPAQAAGIILGRYRPL